MSRSLKPIFTITLTNKSTKKSYSASCNYTTDKEEVATAAFFLPGGEYDIAVYNYTESKDKGDPVAQATYKNNIADTKRRSVHVNYTPKDKKIEVTMEQPEAEKPEKAQEEKSAKKTSVKEKLKAEKAKSQKTKSPKKDPKKDLQEAI